MAYEIRDARRDEIPHIISLLHQFAELVNLAEYLTIDEQRLHDAVFADRAFVQLIVACDGGVVVGYAIFYPHFSSFRGESGFYLEDIFVDRDHRGSGVGRILLGEVARRARSRGFNRIDFQVMRSNIGARRFYERLGAESNSEEIRCKFAGPALDQLAADGAQ